MKDVIINHYDIRYWILSQNQQPSYKAFQRFMNSMKCSIEEVNKYVYLYIQDKKALEEAVLYVDGTKLEAYANKVTFFWSAWGKKHYPRNWKKCMVFRVHSEEKLESKVFVSFIALIIRNEIYKSLKELYKTNRKEYTIPKVLRDYERLGATEEEYRKFVNEQMDMLVNN